MLTLPALLHRESHPDDAGLQSLVEHQPLPGPDLERLLSDIHASGAVAASVDVARDFIRHGLEALERLPAGPEHRDLSELVKSIIARNK